MPAYYLACATDRFGPRDLLEQAVEGEKAYFDGICCSEVGTPGRTWEWLEAAGQATEYVRLGLSVTTQVDADGLATLAARFPSRVFLAVGSPEAELVQVEQALELIVRLFAGERHRPPVYLAGFDEGAAHAAGRLGDGLWTLADAEQTPALVEAYHEGCAEAGKEAGEILLQTSFSLVGTQEQAVEEARAWQSTPLLQERAQATVTDPLLLGTLIGSPDPDEHVARIREIEKLGATAVVLMNVSGEAPLEAVRVYGRDVLPKLRG